MERDFTEPKLIELKGFLNDETLNMGNDAANILANHYDWCEKLDIVEHLNCSTTYEQLLRHKYDTTTVALDNVFTEVRDADQSYAKVIATYSDGAAVIKKYIDQLAAIINPNNGSFTVASCAAAFTQLGLDAKTLRDNKKVRVEEILAKHASDGTPLTEAEKQFLANYLKVMTAEKITGNDLKDKNKLADAERDLLIQLYEALNPENATNMDTLFAGMKADGTYSEDIAYIKYISYTAEEPYRSVFFKYAGEMEIGDFKWNQTQHFDPSDEKLYLNFDNKNDKGLTDKRGPYTTFFHECAHSLDYFAGNKGISYSVTYMDDSKTSLYNAEYKDVETFIQNVAKDYMDINYSNMPAGQKEQYVQDVVTEIMKYDSADVLGKSKSVGNELYQITIQNCGTKVLVADPTNALTQFKWDSSSYPGNIYMRDVQYEAVTDTIGGITNCTIGNGYMHIPDESPESGESNQLLNATAGAHYFPDYTYYYKSDGSSTGKAQKELFAENFSYEITSNTQLSGNIKNYLSNSELVLDSMLEDLADDCKK